MLLMTCVTPIRVTRHARNRMRWDRITEDNVTTAVRAPEWEEPSISGRINRWRRVAGRFPRVTCLEGAAEIVVISAVLKRRPWSRSDEP